MEEEITSPALLAFASLDDLKKAVGSLDSEHIAFVGYVDNNGDITRLKKSDLDVSQTLQEIRDKIKNLGDEDNPQWDQSIDQALQVIDKHLSK